VCVGLINYLATSDIYTSTFVAEPCFRENQLPQLFVAILTTCQSHDQTAMIAREDNVTAMKQAYSL